MGTIFVLCGGNFIPTYSKVLTFQQAKKYVKRETFEKSSKTIFLSRFGKKRPGTLMYPAKDSAERGLVSQNTGFFFTLLGIR